MPARRPRRAGSCSRRWRRSTVGLGAVSLIAGFSDSFPLRLLQGLAVFGAGAVIIGGAVVLVLVRLAGWRDPESEEDFEALVQRAERLAAEDSWGDAEDYDELDDEDDDAVRPRRRGGLQGARPLRDRRAAARVPPRARARRGRRLRRRPPAPRLRPLPGRHRRPRLLPRPDRDLPRHAAARLRPRPGAAQGAGHPDASATSSPTTSGGTRTASAGSGSEPGLARAPSGSPAPPTEEIPACQKQ